MSLEEIDAKIAAVAAERVTVEQNLYRIQGAENLLTHWRAEVEAALAMEREVEIANASYPDPASTTILAPESVPNP